MKTIYFSASPKHENTMKIDGFRDYKGTLEEIAAVVDTVIQYGGQCMMELYISDEDEKNGLIENITSSSISLMSDPGIYVMRSSYSTRYGFDDVNGGRSCDFTVSGEFKTFIQPHIVTLYHDCFVPEHIITDPLFAIKAFQYVFIHREISDEFVDHFNSDDLLKICNFKLPSLPIIPRPLLASIYKQSNAHNLSKLWQLLPDVIKSHNAVELKDNLNLHVDYFLAVIYGLLKDGTLRLGRDNVFTNESNEAQIERFHQALTSYLATENHRPEVVSWLISSHCPYVAVWIYKDAYPDGSDYHEWT